MCLRTTKQWSRWSLKEGVPQWDMFPGLTELRLIGCSIELTWTQKSKSSTSTPKTNSLDILTKGNFTRDEWNHLLCLFNISHFSSTVCSETMAKRSQHNSGEERVTAKSRPMMNFIARVPSNVSSSTSVSPGKRRYGNQNPLSTIAEKEEVSGRPDQKKDFDHYYHEQFMESFSSASYSKWDDDRACWYRDGNCNCLLLSTARWLPIANNLQEFFVHAVLSPDSWPRRFFHNSHFWRQNSCFVNLARHFFLPSFSICDNQVLFSSDESPGHTIPIRSWVSQILVFLICTILPRCPQVESLSSIIKFRPTSNQIPEYRHFEDQ